MVSSKGIKGAVVRDIVGVDVASKLATTGARKQEHSTRPASNRYGLFTYTVICTGTSAAHVKTSGIKDKSNTV